MVKKETVQGALDILVSTGLMECDSEGNYKLTFNGQRYAIASELKNKNAKR